MRVAVTGSSGKVGRAAVRALKGAGHRVTCLDIAPFADHARTVRVDCANFGEVMGALSGVDTVSGKPDAVLHLAGIPMPGPATDHAIFENNTASTYNVFSASARLGIDRVVWASSETILGLPFDTPPDYAPLDDSTPDRPNWSYALSKHLGEAMAEQFARWHASMTIVSLRFSNVFDALDYRQLPKIQSRPQTRKFNLWGYVDAEDCGEACRLAMEAPLTGHHRMIIAAADNLAGQPSASLMAEHFPGVSLKGDISGEASLLSSSAAERLIGYKPRWSWRDRVENSRT